MTEQKVGATAVILARKKGKYDHQKQLWIAGSRLCEAATPESSSADLPPATIVYHYEIRSLYMPGGVPTKQAVLSSGPSMASFEAAVLAGKKAFAAEEGETIPRAPTWRDAPAFFLALLAIVLMVVAFVCFIGGEFFNALSIGATGLVVGACFSHLARKTELDL